MDELGNGFYGAVVGAAIAGLVAIILGLWRAHREDEIRERERTMHAEELALERQASREALLDERNHADRLRDQDRKQRTADQLREAGAAEAKQLLAVLAELRHAWFRESGSEDGGYSYNLDLSLRIYTHARFVPNGQLTEFVTLSVRAIDGAPISKRLGELDGSAAEAQRGFLDDAMDEVTRYVRGETVGLGPDISNLKSLVEDIDRHRDEYFKDQP
jgi:hypothetical protein